AAGRLGGRRAEAVRRAEQLQAARGARPDGAGAGADPQVARGVAGRGPQRSGTGHRHRGEGARPLPSRPRLDDAELMKVVGTRRVPLLHEAHRDGTRRVPTTLKSTPMLVRSTLALALALTFTLSAS